MFLKYLKLLSLSLLIKVVVTIYGLPGNKIDNFIRWWAFRLIKKIGYPRFIDLVINPISSIRYFEFDFVSRNLPKLERQKILDISSPRFFGIYTCFYNRSIKYFMINPDIQDLKETKFYLDCFPNIGNISLSENDALNLPYKNNFFDIVLSISVIEHIDKKSDSKAIKEMWRVLKPGGKLFLTTHVIKEHRNEYRLKDQYNLGLKNKKGKYFFQRMYDENSIKQRLFKSIKAYPKHIEIIGEKNKGWFDSYIKRWIKNDKEETVYDPWYVISKFKKYKSIDMLPGIGIIGLMFKKSNDK